MPKRILVTGGCGFIGHHFIEHLIKNTDWNIVVFDRLNYASGGFDRLRDINVFDEKRVAILAADFTNPIREGLAREIGDVNYIVHMGANTHVDNSITNPREFVHDNVNGTVEVLEFAKTLKNLEKLIIFSTDEVYGPASDHINYKETDRFNPTNPYAAAKAGAECMAMAYANCYKLPIIITNTMNVFGERQHPEKFIPMCIRKISAGESITIHSHPDKIRAGSRFYIHARNVASAVCFLLQNLDMGQTMYYQDEKGMPQFRHRYNIVGEKEMTNLELAQFIATTLNKELKYDMVDFHSSRPGHDLRYSLDDTKMRQLGWQSPKTFEESLAKTINWHFLTAQNKRWFEWN